MDTASKHRLAAVLAADMVGYSRLMGVDEVGTLARLKTHRAELIDPVIAKNGGTIMKTTGDGMLVEFPSVANAVRTAVEVQERMARRNSDVPEDQRIRFRMGINLGDIIFQDNDIFGDGVNIAARLEQLAEPGGICVSAAVHEQVAERVEAAFEDLGEKSLKNIVRPVRVYRVIAVEAEGRGEAARAATLVAASQSKPAVAVLPFDNLSGDPEQEFFVDGLTEDLLTELARRHELLVIARNSTFVYKGKAVDVGEIGRKLGAQFVVEGSVRRAGDRIRITVQLVDASNGSHIWAEKYDRKLDDIFEIQDEVTASIVATLPGRLEAAQQTSLKRKAPSSMVAYELVLVAKVLHHRSNRSDNAEALAMIERAIALDPDYAHAYAWRACILGQQWGYGWADDPEDALRRVKADGERALALDENDADVHRILAAVNIIRNNLSRARYHQDRAVRLNPNYDLAVVQMGELHTWLGNAGEGVEWIRKAMRINPHHPARFWSHLGKAHFTGRNYAEAVSAFMQQPALDCGQHVYLAACYSWLGDGTAAKAHAARARELNPDFGERAFLATTHYANAADLDHLREGLRRAGLAG
ncbi:MAG: adenylate/guanylate cyclase domain-containing protein [Paracoccaceae bacterium]